MTNPVWNSLLESDESDLSLISILGFVSFAQAGATNPGSGHYMDVVVANTCASSNVYLNLAGNGFSSQNITLTDVGGCTDLGIADLNSDGFNDIMSVKWYSDMGVLLNDGNANFTLSHIGSTSTAAQGLGLADLDKDGDIDAVVANSNPGEKNRICINDGAANFSCSVINAVTGRLSRDVAIGDMDADGDPDLIFANQGAFPPRIYYNNGSGNFPTFADADPVTTLSQGIASADLDGDGDLDAFIADAGGVGHRVLINDGSGVFTGSYSCGTSVANGVELADLDGDGDMDAFLAINGSLANQVCLNNGNGSFSGPFNAGTVTNGAKEMALADFDNDGDVDAMSCSDQDYLYTNDGNANFVNTAVGPSQSCDGIFAGELNKQ